MTPEECTKAAPKAIGASCRKTTEAERRRDKACAASTHQSGREAAL